MKTNQNKGISLIVLVITIIVMIILAGAIILALNSSNIIGRAQEARNKTDYASARDVVTLANAEWILMSEAEQTEASSDGTFATYAEKKLEEAGIPEGKYGVGEDGTIAAKAPGGTVQGGVPIPEGFEYVTGTKETGLVIKSNTMNDGGYDEYVWVPVDIIPGGLAIKDYGKGYPYQADKNADNKMPSEMQESIAKYNGFYVGRYEAGISSNNYSGSADTTGTKKPLSQKNKYVWNSIAYDAEYSGNYETDYGNPNNKGAVRVARSLGAFYDNKVGSDLLYGEQWDTICKWIDSSATSVTDSTEWGNYKNHAYTLKNTSAKYSTNYGSSYTNVISNSKTASQPWLLTTGADEKFKAKNIYDFAGNVFEWTHEKYSSAYRMVRGGNYRGNGGNYPASYRNYYNPDYSSNYYGFRVALYIK
ncbi:MAG: SUMF1/EgtB/PvdO family nonheme iron enzyme [Clostridia bacterium]|nr:SUMF1/EgtB/PvdO family nonheme iron enzyme [Clostridia bacterium]MDD4375489.1 SUMF1/EgtB/PvdO family nonheme iron enzyme [Clostridia bacterium]